VRARAAAPLKRASLQLLAAAFAARFSLPPMRASSRRSAAAMDRRARRRARDDEAAQRGVAASRPSYASLPVEVLVMIFALVPADRRPQLARVCRAFRAALHSPGLWARLDLRAASGVARAVTDATVGAFAARFAERAGGRLAALDVSGCSDVTRAALLAVVAANPGVELTLCHPTSRSRCSARLCFMFDAARFGALNTPPLLPPAAAPALLEHARRKLTVQGLPPPLGCVPPGAAAPALVTFGRPRAGARP
jgi:hypothetical protein